MFYNLLRRNIVGCGSHVDLLVNIKAGDDEEYSGTSGTALYQSPQSEDHGSLVLLRITVTRQTSFILQNDDYVNFIKP